MVMTNAAMKKVDDTYTHMLRRVKNVSWRDRLPNAQLYSQSPVPHHSQEKRLLDMWLTQQACKSSVVLSTCKRRRLNITMKDVFQKDTDLMNYVQLWLVGKYGEKITSCNRSDALLIHK